MHNKVNILWTSDDKDNFFNVVSAYAFNSVSRNWWKSVNVMLWGKSINLTAMSPDIREEIKEMIKHGIHVEACKECCEKLGFTSLFTDTGIEVKYLGSAVTGYMKAGEPVITF